VTQLDLDAMKDEAISELKQGRLVTPAVTIIRFHARIRELEQEVSSLQQVVDDAGRAAGEHGPFGQ
jgi:hypothetical protein